VKSQKLMTEFAVTFKFSESGLVSSDPDLAASVVAVKFVEGYL